MSLAESTSTSVSLETALSPAKHLNYLQALSGMSSAAALSDPHQPDMPLVFVNDAFVKLTGYSREEVIGRNCRFLQGDDTDPFEVTRIRKSLAAREICAVELKNYRKDGSFFWNALHLTPIFDASGALVYYHAAQTDVTDILAPRDEGQMRNALAREMHHRVKNLLAVAASIVRLSARGSRDVEELSSKSTRRIEALGRAHAATFAPTGQNNEMADLGAIAHAMLRPFEQQFPKQLAAEGPVVQLPIQAITPVALALHELGANASEHGCLHHGKGSATVDWQIEGPKLVIQWHENCGEPVLPPEIRQHGFGMRAAGMLLRAIDATIDHEWKTDGLEARITVPLNAPKGY